MTRILICWDSLRSSYWFVPGLLCLGSIGLAVGMAIVDRRLNIPGTFQGSWWLYGGDAQGARSVLSTIAGSIVTVTSVTFSITVAAFSLASQQYGPRLLRGFLRDLPNQIVLGVFVATFLYCLLVLRTVRSNFVPNLSITVGEALAIASVGVLIFFIHHVTVSIQAYSIVNNVGDELDAAIKRLYPQYLGEESPATQKQPPEDNVLRAHEVVTLQFGYVTSIDESRLLHLAKMHDLLLRIASRPGAYAEPGAVLLRAYPAERVSAKTSNELRRAFTLGKQRTVTQDVAFGSHELAEIAVRALSPGINNPYTAMMVLDRLRTSLVIFAQRRIPSAVRRDDSGIERVITSPVHFETLLEAVIEPIRHYGSSSPMLLDAILDTLAAVRAHVRRWEDARALSDQEQKTCAARGA